MYCYLGYHVILYIAICIFHQEANATCQLRGEKVHLLQAKGPALKKHVKLSEEFWRALIHNHVLSHLEAKAFQVRFTFHKFNHLLFTC